MGPINKNRSFKRGSSVLLVLLGSYITVMVLSIIAQFGARRAIPSSVVAFHCPIKGRKPFRRRLLDSTPSSSTSRWMELVDSVVNPPDDPNRQEIEKALKRIPTNKELVERRLALNRAKREARERGIQHRVSRNLHIKRLLHSDTTTTTTINTDIDNKDDTQESAATSPSIPPLYAVKVWVDDDLRETLRLTGREKRGRVFIEAGTNGTSTLSGLKGELFAFFRALRKDTFLLTATLPRIAPDGTILSPEDKDQAMVDSWPIETDNDVRKTFEAADEIFRNIMVTHLAERGDASILQRPSIQINVLKDPNAPPPPPIPSYLINMPEPAESESMTMLSFYAFPPSGIADPEAFAFNLKVKWKPFQAVGRVYVAQEGVNAQMGVPTNVLKNFMDCCRSVSELGKYMENDINIDPKPLSRSEFAVAGVPTNGQPAPPFRNLHIRVRNQVVADGLTKSLDWQSAGYDMPPLEWHETLKDAREKKKKMMRGPTTMSKDDVEGNLPIILDCRNTYETGVGIFEGAEPLETENFRESWDVLKKRLADTPKDAPIMTYCTGGIRCTYSETKENQRWMWLPCHILLRFAWFFTDF
jgi:predicted sulfurtransferase